MPQLQDGTTIPFSFNGNGGQLPLLQRLTTGPGGDITIGAMGADNFTQTNLADAGSTPAPKLNYLWYFGVVLVLLVALKFASEHEKSGFEPKLMGVGVWNLTVVTIMAILGIGAAKTLVNQVGSTAPFWTGMKTVVNLA